MKRLGLCFVMACGGQPHVTLGPLPQDPTLEQRGQAFSDLRGTSELVETTMNCQGRGVVSACTQTMRSSMTLGDGRVVRHATDLEPVVPRNSATARAIARVRKAHREQRVFGYVAVFGFAGGVGVAIAGHETDNLKLTISAAGIGVVLLAVSLLVRFDSRNAAAEATHAAFQTYNDDLSQRLGVCVSGIELVACGTDAPLPGVEPLDDPAIRSLPRR